jgi:hypothetical protein
MSNVSVRAIGPVGLIVEVTLGANVRATHLVNAGEAADLTVGGGQCLIIRESKEAAPTMDMEIPIGVDVTEQPPIQGDFFSDDGFRS